MYKTQLTRQSLTDSEMLSLLGISQWVFNSNCHFIIEMIDKEHHGNSNVSWFEFLGLTAGQIGNPERRSGVNLIIEILGERIYNLFYNLKDRRNEIMHSFPTGEKPKGYYVPIYRNKAKNVNVIIDKEYLIKFIKDNEELSSLIHIKRNNKI